MKIAQVAPMFESVPPRLYGGTERIVSYLTEELVRQGHEVTLFASGDSLTRARLVAAFPESLRLGGSCADPMVPHMLELEELARQAHHFDLIHFHCGFFAFSPARRLPVPHLFTVHGRMDLPEHPALFREFPETPLVSISDNQRRPVPEAHWVATIPHGLPRAAYPFHPGPGAYLAFLGRICPEKRLDRAIEIAGRAGLPLKVAAKVDPADQAYYEETIRPLLGQPHVEFLGEIGDREKRAFLGNALALLFPIDWPEPFGMVLIEALACGTPVVAFAQGSVPEVIEDGVTGFLVSNVPAAVRAVRRVGELDRRACRSEFERRFTVERMARDYLSLYNRLTAPAGRTPRSSGLAAVNE
ncbi:MAG: glycosyltransferase family 4 protein [Planctomycetota bacterium]